MSSIEPVRPILPRSATRPASSTRRAQRDDPRLEPKRPEHADGDHDEEEDGGTQPHVDVRA